MVCRTCIVPKEKTNMDISELTFVTYANNNQKTNSFFSKNINSWLKTSEKSKVIIFRNKKKFDKNEQWRESQFPEGRVSYAEGKRTDFRKDLYIDEFFAFGAQLSTSAYTVFIRPDVEITDKWFPVVKRVTKAMETMKINIVGPSLKENGSYSNSSDFFLINLVNKSCDVNIFPPFISSREIWPNWVLGYLNDVSELVSIGEGEYLKRTRKPLSNRLKNDLRSSLNRNFQVIYKKYDLEISKTKWVVKGDSIVSSKGNDLPL